MINLKDSIGQDIRNGLEAAIKAGALPKLKEVPFIVVRRPEDPEHGDYASPIGMILAKVMKKAPLDIIGVIVEHMPKREYVGKLEAIAPGFLNVRINPGWMQARLDDLVQEKDLCGETNIGKGQRYNFEFISANPTGPLTLGNARTAFSVDTLANVLTCAGFNVTREYYINDAGGQIMKLGESILRRILQSHHHKIEYPDEMYQGDYIKDVAKKIASEWSETEGRKFTLEDIEDKALIQKLGEQAADILMADIKQTITDDLKIKFDVWSSERQLRTSGIIEKAVAKLRAHKMTFKKDDAEYLRTTKYGDSEDRVLIKSDGEYAYIAPDIGYHEDKFNRGFDAMFTFVGADHQGHGPKLMAAMEALGHDVSKLHVVAAQWMGMVQGGKPMKFSKRKGNIYTPKELIDEVGYDAARFFMVQHALTTHMDFDLDLAKERNERNPVYYVQYAYVRLQSIMRRAKQEGIITEVDDRIELTSHAILTDTTELALMRHLYMFPEVVADVSRSFEVQALAYYAVELARSIHSFYKHVKVLSVDSEEVRESRIELVVAARKVLGQTLDLLGINKPDVM